MQRHREVSVLHTTLLLVLLTVGYAPRLLPGPAVAIVPSVVTACPPVGPPVATGGRLGWGIASAAVRSRADCARWQGIMYHTLRSSSVGELSGRDAVPLDDLVSVIETLKAPPRNAPASSWRPTKYAPAWR